MDKKQEFLKRILATFKLEAQENIDAISSQLIELENGCSPDRKEEIFELIYRSAHSMKGASRAVNLTDVESLCHAFEDVMSAIRNGQAELNQDVIDLFNDVVDLLSEILFENEGVVSGDLNDKAEQVRYALSCAEMGEPIAKTKKAVKKPKQAPVENQTPTPKPTSVKSSEGPKVDKPTPQLKGKVVEESVDKPQVSQTPKTTPKSVASSKHASDTIRIATGKLDKVLNQAEEMLTLKLSSRQRVRNVNGILNKLQLQNQRAHALQKSHASILKTIEKEADSAASTELQQVMKHCNALSQYMQELEADIKALHGNAVQEDFTTAISIETLLNDVKEIITVPFSVLLDGYPKMVRDIAKDLDKRVNFNVEGDSIEVDRRILENLRTPLMHILRNSIDYGIEDAESRVKHGKSEKGNITIRIDQPESGKVEITVSDDGAGLNTEKLKQLYIKKENIADKDIDKIKQEDYIAYIFKSGISTSDIVTDLSGRGLGLAIVQETIEKMEGQITVHSEKGKYTAFKILLPISILTYRGVLVSAGKRKYIVPTSKVKSALRIKRTDISTLENKATIAHEGLLLPLADLSLLLGLKAKREEKNYVQILILRVEHKMFALVVDNVQSEQEVLVKAFNKQLKRVRNIAGATVLGSGEVVPILNVADLFQSMTRSSASYKDNVGTTEHKKKHKILVVEDSITSRTLLKNVLETRGYDVVTAIDGLDGYIKLTEIKDFDAVMSDVEMPRLNGFELTAKIRETPGFGIIPVVLITSLSTKEHKARGVEVGASAYIVKGDFQQNTLFDVLDSLIVN